MDIVTLRLKTHNSQYNINHHLVVLGRSSLDWGQRDQFEYLCMHSQLLYCYNLKVILMQRNDLKKYIYVYNNVLHYQIQLHIKGDSIHKKSYSND